MAFDICSEKSKVMSKKQCFCRFINFFIIYNNFTQKNPSLLLKWQDCVKTINEYIFYSQQFFFQIFNKMYIKNQININIMLWLASLYFIGIEFKNTCSVILWNATLINMFNQGNKTIKAKVVWQIALSIFLVVFFFSCDNIILIYELET